MTNYRYFSKEEIGHAKINFDLENSLCLLTLQFTLFLVWFKSSLNPIPAGGGANLTLPVVFLHNSKSVGLRLLKFSDFSYIPKALPLGLKPGFNTNCLSPQAHYLNDCFFL